MQTKLKLQTLEYALPPWGGMQLGLTILLEKSTFQTIFKFLVLRLLALLCQLLLKMRALHRQVSLGRGINTMT